ncbi:hypothetical protein SK128_015258 [Halocaridina rubra]|uniref:Chitin-binding type-2 domain-containing protein n=1 Tax=Halocaridina rubra TaxID=373956 RepID=A0AAN9FU13_HALRR
MAGKRCPRYLLVMSATLTMVGSQSCDPDCSGQNPGTKVEDPRNCTRYYICMAGELPSDVPLPCPSGEEFMSGVCQAPAPGATPCSPSCSPTGCHLTCTSIGDHIADPFNCQAFYTCDVGGPGIVQFCPESIPHFDHSQQKCANDESVCCSPSCEPYCDTNVIQIADPTDCTKFYICDSAPIYPPFSCPPGEIFDIGIGHCSSAGE